MKTTKLATLTLILALTLTALYAGTTTAITGNTQPDNTPYVGIIVPYADAAKTTPLGTYCSGFLISPTVMVTAGHGIKDAAAVSVCFSQNPLSLQDGAVIYSGKPVMYPDYNSALNGNQEFQTSDIGLIILDEPVTGVELPVLPEAGFTENLPTKTDLTIIGYGVQTQTAPKNIWAGTISRNSATAQLSNSNFQGSDIYLKLTANDAQGKGAIAFGDSGGPVIYNLNGQDVAVALNAFVSSSNCNGVSYHTRLDTVQVLDWIRSYLS